MAMIETLKAQGRESRRRFASSGRFSGHGFSGRVWRVDVHIDLLDPAASAEKLAAEHEERGDNYDHKYCHYCCHPYPQPYPSSFVHA
jgi:hypothetical protein